LLATIKALASMQDGNCLQITATDLNAPSNLAAWCRQSGHEMHDMYEENGKFVIFIRCTNQHNPEGDK
jgi:TusA-related sulfurtransferase